jgi:hypothetical protein
MALARVVTFDGVDSARIAELKNSIENGEPPEGMPPSELMILHDASGESALAVLIVDNEDDYAKAHDILDSMPSDGTPGSRTSVAKFDVAVRVSN